MTEHGDLAGGPETEPGFWGIRLDSDQQKGLALLFGLIFLFSLVGQAAWGHPGPLPGGAVQAGPARAGLDRSDSGDGLGRPLPVPDVKTISATHPKKEEP